MQNIDKKQAFSSAIANFFKGLLIGIFSILPLWQIKHTERLLQKESVSGFQYYFSKTLPYLLGIAFASTMMFYSPIQSMVEKYHGGIYIGLLLLSLCFIAYEIYSFVKIKEKGKRHWIASGIVFLLVFLLCFCFNFVTFSTPKDSSLFPFIILFVLSIGSFLASFSGISPSSLFFFLGIYLTDSTYLNETLYQGLKGNLFLLVIFALGIFIGNTFYRYFHRYFDNAGAEKNSCNIAIYFAAILTLAIYKIKSPFFFESDVIPMISQIITMFATVFSFAIVGIVLTFPQYPFYNSGIKVKKSPIKGRIRRR